MRVLWLVGYVLSILAANWAIQTFGLVSVGWGLVAPAGVFFAGLSFTLRDGLQDALGRRWVLAAIVAGAALSALLSPALALASGIAFLASEVLDMAVYTPLRERRWLLAVVLSGLVGAVVDSALFLWLAFGSLDFLLGQVVGKAEMVALAAVVLWWWRQGAVPTRDSSTPVAGAD